MRSSGRPDGAAGRSGGRAVAPRSQGPDRVIPTGDRKPIAPEIPEDVLASDLDRAARSRLRTLSKDNADGVARHLVMAGRLMEDEPELAYAHAQAAVRRAGRVDVVREAAAITAYRTGRYAEALRELRTVRRLNGSDEHLPLMADCERGLGRPDRAIAVAQEDGARALPEDAQVELAIVVSGARLDLGDPEAALATLGTPTVRGATGELSHRVTEARASALVAAGRDAEAHALLDALPADYEGSPGGTQDDVVVFDLEDDGADHDVPVDGQADFVGREYAVDAIHTGAGGGAGDHSADPAEYPGGAGDRPAGPTEGFDPASDAGDPPADLAGGDPPRQDVG